MGHNRASLCCWICHGPVVYAISDEGTIKFLLSEHSFNRNGVLVTALAIDQIRLRLIVTFSNPSSVSAYDLKSYRRIYAMPLPQLDGAPSGIVVDLESGEVLVSCASRGVLLKVGPYGDTLQEIVLSAQIKLLNNISNLQIKLLNNISNLADTSVSNNHTLSKRIIYELKNFDDGLSGIMYLSHGYILVLQTTTGKIVKVDTIDGTVTEVLHRDSSIPLAPSGHTMSLQTKKSIVVATNQSSVNKK